MTSSRPFISIRSLGLDSGTLATESTWKQDKDLKKNVQAQAAQKKTAKTTAFLAFTCLGIVYGDIGTSPLYVYASTFLGTPSQEEVYGVASLIFWVLTSIALFKYVFVVMSADHDGEGGTFALYALLCRTMRISPNDALQQAPQDHAEVLAPTVSPDSMWCGLPASAQHLRTPRVASAISRTFRNSRFLQMALLTVTVVATGMVIGDGIITPSISVLSAVGGLINIPTDAVQNGGVITQPKIAGISIAILGILFIFQSQGTRRISASFAPIIAVWLLFNFCNGWYNMATYGINIWKVINPGYIYSYFVDDGKHGAIAWGTLAGVMLCVTGTEAMFADMGHFNQASIMLSFTFFVYPCLVVTYLGQAAFLAADPAKYPDNAAQYARTFWASLPPGQGTLYAMLVIATLAAIVASQAMISGCFSIIRQAINLGVFPKLQIIHTDPQVEGQIYIGAVNWFLMILCIAITAGFGINSPIIGEPLELANAYGVSVMFVMWFTTVLVTLVILVVWELHPLIAFAFFLPFFCLETVLLSANLIKVPKGGWFTLLIAGFMVLIKLSWWAGTRIKARTQNKFAVPITDFITAAPAATAQDITNTTGMSTADSAHHKPINKDGTVAIVRGGNMAEEERLVFAETGVTIVSSSPALGVYFHDSESSGAMPSVMQAMLSHTRSVHKVALLVTVRVLPVPYIPLASSILVRPVAGLPRFFQVVVRKGFQDVVNMGPAFMSLVVSKINRMLEAASRVPPVLPTPLALAASTATVDAGNVPLGKNSRLMQPLGKSSRLTAGTALAAINHMMSLGGGDIEAAHAPRMRDAIGNSSLAHNSRSLRYSTAAAEGLAEELRSGSVILEVNEATKEYTTYRLTPEEATASIEAIMAALKEGVVYYIGCSATKVLPRPNPVVSTLRSTFFEWYAFLERNSYADYLAWEIPQDALVEVRTPTPV